MDNAFLHPLYMIGSAIIGLAAGALFDCSQASVLIEPLLIVMLFFVFTCISLREVGDSFANGRFTLTAVFINFVWTPVFALMLGLMFPQIDVRIGLLMLLVTPCTDWYLIFTSAAKGNVPLSSSLLPVNLILQILLMPAYILLFFNTSVPIDAADLLLSMAVVLVIPIAASALVKLLSVHSAGIRRFDDAVVKRGDNLQLTFLCLAIAAMFASQSSELLNNLDLFVKLLIPLILFFIVNYAVASLLSKLQKYDRRNTTSLIFTSMARNSPLALAIAAAAFPSNTLLLLVLVIGPLIELPILSITAGYRLKKAGSD